MAVRMLLPTWYDHLEESLIEIVNDSNLDIIKMFSSALQYLEFLSFNSMLLRYFAGEFVWPDLSENIITECLKRSVPNTSSQVYSPIHLWKSISIEYTDMQT